MLEGCTTTWRTCFRADTITASKNDVWDMVQSLPRGVRNKIITGARRFEDSILNMIIPNSLFEDLGFRYIGPINGHDLPTAIKILKQVRNNISEPALVHMITKKGKGYEFAERDATKFHGISSFNNITGEINKKRVNIPNPRTLSFLETL